MCPCWLSLKLSSNYRGFLIALGTAPCVGILGAALGAGVSANQGYSGLLADLLQEVQIVTASGDAVRASRTQNPGLFWALRGAGANFGIVTSATFKVLPTINGGNVTNANYMFLSNKAPDVYQFLATLDYDMPAELALNIGSLFVPGTDQVRSLSVAIKVHSDADFRHQY